MGDKSKNLADALFPVLGIEEDALVVDLPLEKRQLHTEAYDFSVSTIYDYLKKGQLTVPSFQRAYVWNRSQASRLIESLIIQCPIPVIFLNQNSDETYSVIDGNQRIKSIELFLDDDYSLSGLSTYPDLEGLYFSELDVRLQRHIRNRIIRCIVILKTTHPQIKFDVFSRINTGAVQLNPQELRHGVYYGNFMQLIEELCLYSHFKKIVGPNMAKRMKDAELILRFFALFYSLDDYSKPMVGFLNRFAEANRSLSDRKILRYKNVFFRIIDDLFDIFGDRAFRNIDSNGKIKSNQLNAALFDAVTVGYALASPKVNLILNNHEDFMKSFATLLNSNPFIEYITSGTSTKNAVIDRIRMTEDFFGEYK